MRQQYLQAGALSAERLSRGAIGAYINALEHELRAAPPQANALVAAAYRKAAEIVGELENKSRDNVISSALKIAKSGILSAIPADAEAALRERDYAMCMKAAVEAYIAGQEHGRHGKTADLDAIVNSVLGEGK
jgi:hypothetical protein